MKKSFFNQVGILLIVAVAFVDGMLVANHLQKNQQEVTAAELVMLEDVFEELHPIVEEEEATIEAEPTVQVIPFTSQAPYGIWEAPWSDYAEEAVLTMAMQWVRGEAELTRDEAVEAMLAIGTWEGEQWGHSKASTLEQTLFILTDFFKHTNVSLKEAPSFEEIIAALEEGALIIAPVNGQTLENPYYGTPGPLNHMILITDYDVNKNQFIAHDPGTSRGENFEYEAKKLLDSIQDLDGSSQVLIIQP